MSSQSKNSSPAKSKRELRDHSTTEDGDTYPLSFAQTRLWFMEQLSACGAAYSIFQSHRLKGVLDLPALRRALQALVHRQQSLRTTFLATADGPVQRVHPEMRVDLRVIDLDEVGDVDREERARELVAEETGRPFDLTGARLFRAQLVRLTDQDHILTLNMHHIVSDGWSMGVLFRDLCALYEACRKGEPCSLAPLLMQCTDFAAWQREWLCGPVLQRHLDYWRERLAGMETLQLPTDRARPAVQSFGGAVHSRMFAPELSEGLRALSRREDASLFTTLLAAFVVFLQRYSGQEDIVVGTVMANRNPKEVEGLVGFFLNMLPLRVDTSGDPSFQALLARARAIVLEAKAHQGLPFEKMVHELRPERDPSRNPIFQVAFIQQKSPNAPLALGELTLSPINAVPMEARTARFDLEVYVVRSPAGLETLFYYNTDLFEPATIQRMLGHYERLLEGVVADPSQRISELPLLTDAERRQLLVEWNATEMDYPRDKCIHELFEEQVVETPDAIALIFEGKELTYAELNVRANQLAHQLRAMRVAPDTLVGICVQRSLEMVVGILGILKAGGAYVPLDPAYPPARLAHMLADSRAPVLLTQAGLVEQLSGQGAQVLRLDSDWPTVAQHPVSNPVNCTRPEDLAYCLYTSGSTGKPKGVALRHSNAVGFLAWAARAFEREDMVRVLFSTSISFDLSVFEMFTPLVSGGSVLLVQDVLALSQIPHAFTPSLINTVPSAAQALLDAKAIPDTVRIINLAGEPLRRELVAGLRSAAPQARIYNLYGPTEYTTYATYCEVDADSRITVGRPVANTQIYILDERLTPVPVGVIGEIHIAGTGLARGYWDRPALTAEKFVANPFGSPGSRMYKTGDLGRYLSDGRIEFLARIDHQVKMRGYRIELGEIEATLREHPGVQDTVVSCREDVPGEKRLVAYVVAVPEWARSEDDLVSQLRAHAQAQLPYFMVPAALVVLDALPLTPNGKVDRQALPAPEQLRASLGGEYVAPRTEVEARLAEIWAEVLQLDRVGIHDNFFELGGDSILGLQAIARFNETGFSLTPKEVFHYPTISALVAACGEPKLMRAEQGPVTGTVPLTPIQKWFFEQQLPEPQHFNQAVMLDMRRTVDPDLLERAVGELLNHHDALRLRFVKQDGLWLQRVSAPEQRVPFSVIDLRPLAPAQQSRALLAKAKEQEAGLDFQNGPLLRAALFKLGSGQADCLLIAVHHLAVDGVSWRILLEDLERAYLGLERDGAIRLSAKTTSFKAWSERLCEYARSDTVRAQLKYWLDFVKSDVRPLPVDYAETGRQTTVGSSDRVVVSLDERETEALVREVPSAYKTRIDEVLMTALLGAFSGWTRDANLLVDLERHGRESLFEDVDLSRTVGWFTAIFPLRLTSPPDLRPDRALESVKEQLCAVPQGGIGYGLLRYLVENAGVVEALRALPRPEVSFNYLGQFDQAFTRSSLFELSGRSPGPVVTPRSSRRYLIEIEAAISGKRLQMMWTYGRTSHRRTTIERLSAHFIQILQSLIGDCRSPDAGARRPSDSFLIDVDQSALDRLVKKRTR